MQEDYVAARKIGQKEYKKAVIEGKNPYPPVLDEILKNVDVLAQVPVGTMEIPLSMVVGTKTAGRTTAFSHGFMPILKEGTEFAAKWQNLYDAQNNEGIRDPVKVYEFMNRFYVLEGNKRVSVSKYVGLNSIMADITRVLPKRSDVPETRTYYSFVKFFNVFPDYELHFSDSELYVRFAELMGQNLTDPWPEEVQLTVRAAFASFKKIFTLHGGKRLGINTADAFVIYLMVYPIKTLLDETDSEIATRIERIWNEFRTQTNRNNIAVVESPDEARRTGQGIMDVLDILKIPEYTLKHPLRVAFIYDKNPDDSRWIYGHELGRNYIESRFAGLVETIRFDNCSTDEKLAKAICAAAADEDSLIITTSPAQMPETLRNAVEYPNIRFLNCSINLSHSAVRTYYARMHEVRFILGALAATVATNHRIGYLSDYPIYGVIAGINAFAAGASLVDPEAKIILKWSTKKDTNWEREFREEGVYVISGPDMIKPQAQSREYGLYQLDPLEAASGASEDELTIRNIAAPVMDWGKYYELIIRTILDGSWDAKTSVTHDRAINYWYGMESGVIDIILSEHLPYTSGKLVNLMKRGIINGVLKPFGGELHSQTGIIKKEDDPDLTPEEIITMDWLCENVVGEIPAAEGLSEEAKNTIRVSGVEEKSEVLE